MQRLLHSFTLVSPLTLKSNLKQKSFVIKTTLLKELYSTTFPSMSKANFWNEIFKNRHFEKKSKYSRGTGQIWWDGRLKYDFLLKNSAHFFAGGDIMQLIYDFLTEYLLIYSKHGTLFISLPNKSLLTKVYWYMWYKDPEYYLAHWYASDFLYTISSILLAPGRVAYSLEHPIKENSITLEMPLKNPILCLNKIEEVWRWIQEIESKYSFEELLKLHHNQLNKINAFFIKSVRHQSFENIRKLIKTNAFIDFLKEKTEAKESIGNIRKYENETIKVWETKFLLKYL